MDEGDGQTDTTDYAKRQAEAAEKLLRLHQAFAFWFLVVLVIGVIVWLSA